MRPYNPERVSQLLSVQDWMGKRIDEFTGVSVDNDMGLSQAMYARDCLHPLLENSGDKRAMNPMWVASEHTSKSMVLPVIHYSDTVNGLYIWMRNNFYDWKVSVSSTRQVPDVFYRLFNREDDINGVYCEGFHESWVFGSYAANPHEFTVELPGSLYTRYFNMGVIFTFCYLLGESLHDARQ